MFTLSNTVPGCSYLSRGAVGTVGPRHVLGPAAPLGTLWTGAPQPPTLHLQKPQMQKAEPRVCGGQRKLNTVFNKNPFADLWRFDKTLCQKMTLHSKHAASPLPAVSVDGKS